MEDLLGSFQMDPNTANVKRASNQENNKLLEDY